MGGWTARNGWIVRNGNSPRPPILIFMSNIFGSICGTSVPVPVVLIVPTESADIAVVTAAVNETGTISSDDLVITKGSDTFKSAPGAFSGAINKCIHRCKLYRSC